MNAPITVTFDSNVWEIIVDESKRDKNTNDYQKLFLLINSKLLKPYFFEGIVTMESVLKNERKKYIAEHKTNISIQIGSDNPIIVKGSPPPPITPYLEDNIPKAIQLGFRFLRMPRIGGSSIKNNDCYAVDEFYTIEQRQSRTFECVRFIESLGAGKSMLHNNLDGNSHHGIVAQTKNDTSLSDKKYSESFGEWVDGDALAAHYGYGINYFCTNDQAKNAGIFSVFSENNLRELKNEFGIQVVSPHELVQLVPFSR